MKRIILVFLSLCIFFIPPSARAQSSGNSAQDSPTLRGLCTPGNGGISLPEGFCAEVVADNLGPLRQIVVRDNGDLYARLLSSQIGGSVLALRDTDGDGRLDEEERFFDQGGTGIVIWQDYLYFSTPQAIYRQRLSPGRLRPVGEVETVVSGFPDQRQHAAKSFAISSRGELFVNIGAPSNACQRRERTEGSPGVDPCPQLRRHAGIWRFSAAKIGQSMADGDHFASGIRNAVAIAWNPLAGHLYVVQHGRDQLRQLWPQLYSVEMGAQLPAEEFFQVDRGDNFGWPYCYYDQLQGKKVLAPEYGGDGRKIGRCGRFQKPIAAFPGHWAPNGLLFYTADQFPKHYRGGAFIAFHGSWNRAPLPQKGYKVVFVPFSGGAPSGAGKDFATGFAGEKTVRSPGEARFRPMGLAQGPDGSLYISDTKKGRIWRVRYVVEAKK
jgi:glucose/arabinose dehydrogenase